MSDNNDDPKNVQDQLKKYKPKKKKLTVPKEFLDNANSYDDKLIVVKSISEREKQRVVKIMKGLLVDAVNARTKTKK